MRRTSIGTHLFNTQHRFNTTLQTTRITQMLYERKPTHSLAVGYLCWLFGFTGAHRFYYDKQISGTIWFFTLGLLGIGWLIDLVLIPSMHARAGRRYAAGDFDYTIAWVLLTFLGMLGIHRLYLGKWVTGIVWFLTGGLFLIGWLYDLWTFNEQVSVMNQRSSSNGAAWRDPLPESVPSRRAG